MLGWGGLSLARAFWRATSLHQSQPELSFVEQAATGEKLRGRSSSARLFFRWGGCGRYAADGALRSARP